MLLLARPPYLRWIAGGVLVLGALAWELSERATEPFPFAVGPIESGTPITEDLVEWKQIPEASLVMPDLTSASALARIERGDPLTRSVVGYGSDIPDNWWSVPMVLPSGVPRGTDVRLTFLDGSSVAGIVAVPATDDEFGIERAGTVAVAEPHVERVALAAASDALLVVIAP